MYLDQPANLVMNQKVTTNGETANHDENDYIYDPEILATADLGPRYQTLRSDPNLKVRPLRLSDYYRGFLELLKQLTVVGDISYEEFSSQFEAMKSAKGTYYVTVIEDTSLDRIVGSATLLFERKFIRNCGLRARLEDVVVSHDYRGKQLGKCIVEIISKLGQHLGGYKISLDCKDEMIPFYESLGYHPEPGNANSLVIRYPAKP
nr:EOG090X0FKI [Eulimnadia texana]